MSSFVTDKNTYKMQIKLTSMDLLHQQDMKAIEYELAKAKRQKELGMWVCIYIIYLSL
jgi:hypothetical protein